MRDTNKPCQYTNVLIILITLTISIISMHLYIGIAFFNLPSVTPLALTEKMAFIIL